MQGPENPVQVLTPPLSFIPFRHFVPESEEQANAPGRIPIRSKFLFPILTSQAQTLREVRQVSLLREHDFASWARKLGVEVSGVVFETDVERYWRQGWLRVDEARKVSRKGTAIDQTRIDVLRPLDSIGTKQPSVGRWNRLELEVHPFRLYPFLRLTKLMEWNLTRSSVLYGPGVVKHASDHVKRFQCLVRSPQFLDRLDEWNGIADLAILLEPIYWPKITSRRVFAGWNSAQPAEDDQIERLRDYKCSVLETLQNISKGLLAFAHMELRHQAGMIDDNHELYLLLRASKWERRGQLKGGLGCALWLRHVAEILRLGFDEIYEDRLVHEDEAFGWWHDGAREWLYGSEYPLENPAEMVRRVLPRWGIASSPRVRLYVEGDTEEGALKEALSTIVGFGIDVINLRAQGWGTWLSQELSNDVKAKRFSMLMVDTDRADVLKVLRLRSAEGLIVGMIFKNTPDFEFGCFSIEQLVEAIHIYEQVLGLENLEPLDNSSFKGIISGRDFQDKYCQLRKAPQLKGQEWGRALAKVAFESRQSANDESNKFVFAVACAIRGITTDYEAQKVKGLVDPVTLNAVDTGRQVFGNRDKQ